VNSWTKSYTVVDGCGRGKKVIVPGDGSSLWTITHNTDFAKGLVGLLGNPQTIGHAFHITSDEVMCWTSLWHRGGGRGRGGEDRPHDVRFPGRLPTRGTGSLTGDKASSVVFDNSKIKRFRAGLPAPRFPSRKACGERWRGSTPTRRGGKSTRRPTRGGQVD